MACKNAFFEFYFYRSESLLLSKIFFGGPIFL